MLTTLQTPTAPKVWQQGMRALSTGAKLMLIGVLALFMSLVTLWIDTLNDERAHNKQKTVNEISEHVGGPQTLLGPTLLVPYTYPASAVENSKIERSTYVIFATTASAAVKVKADTVKRQLVSVPVYQSQATMQASFNLAVDHDALPAGAILDWTHAELIVGMSDARGSLGDATVITPSGPIAMTPAVLTPRLSYGEGDNKQWLTLVSTHPQVKEGDTFTTSVSLNVSGAQRVTMLPYGRSTQVDMRGNWTHPAFNGGLLPQTSQVDGNGFHAIWNVPFIARGVAAQGDLSQIKGLEAAAPGASLVEGIDTYRSITRSLKYAPLFLGLVFLTYFLFEVTTGKRLHIAQYLLVGLAQLIFYLLLLSFSEHTGFDIGFLIAGGASVALLATNVGWVFASKLQAMRAAGVFGALYGMIYMLLRLEDNALMVGAIGSFAAVAAAMYFTRSIDWYGAGNTMRTAGGPSIDRVGEL